MNGTPESTKTPVAHLEAEARDRSHDLEDRDLLVRRHLRQHDVELVLLVGGLLAAAAAAPPATAIATGALLASTPNVSSIFETSSDASTRVRPLMSSRMESTDASMRTDVGRAGGAMNPATATAEAAMRRRCIFVVLFFTGVVPVFGLR